MKYLIDVPPPTISGLLHMGHVFSYCHMDFVARAKRMDHELVYPFCFDCNGLPTEKLAQKQNIHEASAIVEFAQDTSQMYEALFESIGMGWSEHRYHTFDQNAIATALWSFDDLKEKGLAYKAVREYYWCPKHNVSVSQAELDDEGRYERSGAIAEIRSGEGWFINILDHLPRLRTAIDAIKWHPDHFRVRLHRWLDELKYDWSISRERNYGIQIPNEPGIVFDTWFTSSLTPQLTRATETGSPSLDVPIFDARFQAHDIIRTWVFFTIIKSVYHNDQIPWRNIFISGHALDKHGKKISKSAGNFVPPQTYLDRYGMNGVRYWAALNQLGTDTKSDEQMMLAGKKLVNKIKNAGRFLHMNAEKSGESKEHWIEGVKFLGTLQTHLTHDLNWPLALQNLQKFFWHTFCDVWIEEAKSRDIHGTLRKVFAGLIDYFEVFFPNIREEVDPFLPI